MSGMVSDKRNNLSLNRLIQSILFLGIIFMINLGYYKSIFHLNPTHIIMMVLCVYAAFRICTHRTVVLNHMAMISVYQMYTLISHGCSIYDFLCTLAILLMALALLNGKFNIDLFWSVVETWAVIATTMVIIQVGIYYITGNVVDFFPVDLVDELRLLEDQKLHLYIVQNGILRPSAFFAEPSHFTHFVAPLLIQYVLDEEKRNRKLKLLLYISVGVILTTSGMGIITVVFVWLFVGMKMLYSIKAKYVIYGFSLMVVTVASFAMLFNFNASFQAVILRMFVTDSSSMSALDGRMAGIGSLFDMLEGSELWFGTGEVSNRINGGFIGGLFQIIYTNGIIGVTLYVCLYLYSAIKLKGGKRWNSLYIVLISLFAGIHSYAYMFYYVFAIYSGFVRSNIVVSTEMRGVNAGVFTNS